MKKLQKDLIWHQAQVILGKWARDKDLTKEEEKILLEAQNLDIKRYKAMRIAARDLPSNWWESDGCW